MALVSCPDCSTDVSDKAPACPKCGSPIAAASDVRNAGVQLITVQETSKRLKLHTLGSSLLTIIGVVMAIGDNNSSATDASALPGLMIIAGFGWFIVTRFRIWWHHK